MGDAYASQKRRQNAILVIAGVVAAFLAIGAGLSASGLLKLGAKSSSAQSLQAQGNDPARHLLADNANAPKPELQATATAPLDMPKDIRDWLEHLRRIEELKRELVLQQQTELQGSKGALESPISTPEDVQQLADPNGDMSKIPHNQMLQDTLRRMKIRWTDLDDDFRKYPPPAECQSIADSFDKGLNSTAGYIQSIAEALDSLDMTRLDANSQMGNTKDSIERMGRTNVGDIDDAYHQTNLGIQAICQKYNVKPWFSIDEHGGAGQGSLDMMGGL